MNGKVFRLKPVEAEKAPDELVSVLRDLLAKAESGSLCSVVALFTCDADEKDARGVAMTEEQHILWRVDNRQDRLHSDCHVLAHTALARLFPEEVE